MMRYPLDGICRCAPFHWRDMLIRNAAGWRAFLFRCLPTLSFTEIRKVAPHGIKISRFLHVASIARRIVRLAAHGSLHPCAHYLSGVWGFLRVSFPGGTQFRERGRCRFSPCNTVWRATGPSATVSGSALLPSLDIRFPLLERRFSSTD